jgi:hypothetical protein
MGVHPGPAVVRAKGFLTGDVNRRLRFRARMGACWTIQIGRQPKRLPRSHHLNVTSLRT